VERTDGNYNGSPGIATTLDAYYLDQHEVTIGEFQASVRPAVAPCRPSRGLGWKPKSAGGKRDVAGCAGLCDLYGNVCRPKRNGIRGPGNSATRSTRGGLTASTRLMRPIIFQWPRPCGTHVTRAGAVDMAAMSTNGAVTVLQPLTAGPTRQDCSRLTRVVARILCSWPWNSMRVEVLVYAGAQYKDLGFRCAQSLPGRRRVNICVETICSLPTCVRILPELLYDRMGQSAGRNYVIERV